MQESRAKGLNLHLLRTFRRKVVILYRVSLLLESPIPGNVFWSHDLGKVAYQFFNKILFPAAGVGSFVFDPIRLADWFGHAGGYSRG